MSPAPLRMPLQPLRRWRTPVPPESAEFQCWACTAVLAHVYGDEPESLWLHPGFVPDAVTGVWRLSRRTRLQWARAHQRNPDTRWADFAPPERRSSHTLPLGWVRTQMPAVVECLCHRQNGIV